MDNYHVEAQAIQQALKWHAGQTYPRAENKWPFVVHPILVALHCYTSDQKVVALLHDIVEDTTVTVDDIRQEFGDRIACAIDAITRRDGENYDDYIERVAKNPTAAEVKVADLSTNLYFCLAEDAPDFGASLSNRYKKALERLLRPYP